MPASVTVYRVFGIDVQSELVLPELALAKQERDGVDVVVRTGRVERPDGLMPVATGVAADARHFWMDVPDVARILVSSGCEIVVDPVAGAQDRAIRAFLLGSAMGALLHQRNMLPLHASVVTMVGGAVAFMGTSGAGKSTLALQMADRGHGMLSDDICAVTFDGDTPRVGPGPRRLKLWHETLTAAGRTPDTLDRILPGLDKYQLPIDPAASDSVPLKAIFLLGRAPVPAIERMGGAAAAAALVANTFRGELVGPMASGMAHFQRCITIARGCGVMRLMRPWSLGELDWTAKAIEKLFLASA